MTAMAKIELQHVQAFKDRHGKLRHYYRRKGFSRVALPGPAGSVEFMAAYAAAEARAPRPVAAAAKVQPRSINALMVEYYQSVEYRDLRESTKTGYRNMLERFRQKHGSKGVASVTPQHLERIFHDMADTPGAAQNLRRRLSRVFRLAVRLGWRSDNPVAVTEFKRRKTDGFTPWSEAEIEAFEARWPSGTRERLALYLLLYTGQRRSDVVGMGKQHISEGRISVRQLKTDARLRIRLHPRLVGEIAAAPVGMTFLVTQYGAPFTAAGFTQWFVERAVLAGIHGRTPHGLRKASGRRLAEAGCSTKQIAAILGHATLSEVERYTRDADQARLADDAMDLLVETEARTGAVKPV